MSQIADIFLTLVTEHSLALIACAGLIAMSGTFSGCETSLFSLSAPELNRIRASKGGIDGIIAILHRNLKSLLPSILFANQAVNVLVFALSASMSGALGEKFGSGVSFLVGLACLFLVVFFGEVFPKQFAISSSLVVARLTSFQVWIVYRVLAKPMIVLNALVTACERVIHPGSHNSVQLREEELRLLVELSRNDGVISEGEYELIDGVVELPDVRIRDIMIPRIDAAAIQPDANLAEALETARRHHHCKMPMHSGNRDDFEGWIDVRDIFADHGGQVDDCEETVGAYRRDFQFFSEHDRSDQALERIKGGGGDLYAVVDERGFIVGFFTLQDIMDEVLGHFGEDGSAPPDSVREENGIYILPGRLSVKEWRELFNVSAAIPRSATVGGLIVSLLGRMARHGDRVRLENMEMTVRAIKHHRVAEVGLRLIPREDGK